MINKLEIFPNEIFLNIFSYLSWDEILISFWSLNKRIDSLICSIFSTNNKNGIILNKPDLSYKNFSIVLLPLILNSSSLSSNITSIHFDGINSFSFDFIYENIFYRDNESIFCFPNLKSLNIRRCLLSQPLIQILSLLIQYQLNQLTLSFDEDTYQTFDDRRELSPIASDQEKIQTMFQQILCQIFSDQCQLTSLQLDITKSFYSIHQCLNSDSHLQSNTISNRHQSYCLTLRRLYIRLDYRCFLEHIIEHIPNLEQLSVHFRNSLVKDVSFNSDIQTLILSNGNWFNKVPKLEYFTLESVVANDLEFSYLKWLLNNVNHVQKLEIRLYSGYVCKTDQMIWKSFIDANFIRQYCLPDEIINLKDFRFYICANCQLSLNDIPTIINSFKINSFFIDHQWTNFKCFYEEDVSLIKHLGYQHLFSSILDKFQLFDGLFNYRYISHDLSNIRHIQISFNPSLYSFFEQFNKLCPNTSCITISTEDYVRESNMLTSLTTLFKVGQRNLNNIQFENVTKLRFGISHRRKTHFSGTLKDQDKVRAKILAHLISMPVQLKYLYVERFQWLLHVIQYAFDDLRKNALSTVRYAEFSIPTCNFAANESIDIGKHLVPFLSTYMPHLQTLRLWRPDDFPWTSIRPSIKSKCISGSFINRWKRYLDTFKSINEHVTVFEQDLSQLVQQLKQFVFLDIYGIISSAKVEHYRLMIQTRFPNSQFDVQISRFRLWI